MNLMLTLEQFKRLYEQYKLCTVSEVIKNELRK
jgi:hypothetical protein